jgi:bifunctional non-homologous end joining protein LigD
VSDVEPADLTIATVPARVRERGDPAAGIDEAAFSIEPLLELAARDEAGGLGDAPWPPHFAKQPGEARRVAPSRAAGRRGSGRDEEHQRGRGGRRG